jgi:hypothetical protein
LAIKGEKKDETRGKEVRDRRGRKKKKRGENETAEKKKQWEESVKKREAEGVSRIREKTERRRNQQRNRGPAANATPTEELSHHLLFLFQNEGNCCKKLIYKEQTNVYELRKRTKNKE